MSPLLASSSSLPAAVRRRCRAVVFAAMLCGAALTACVVAMPRAAWAQAQQQRYVNIVNQRFATVSSGPQSSLVLDSPSGASAGETDTLVRRRVRDEWNARVQAFPGQMAQMRRAGLLKGRAVIPASTLVMVRKSGRLVVPPMPKKGRGVGGGTLTFRFTGFEGVTVRNNQQQLVNVQEFLTNFVAVAYPRIVNVYGQPAVSGEVEVVNMGFFDNSKLTERDRLAFGAYDVSGNRILLPLYESLDSIAHALLLNMVHSFHGPAVFAYDGWEQGFSRAVASIVARDPALGFVDATANNLYSLLKFYDILNQPPLGNPTFFPPSQAAIPIDSTFTIAKMLYPRMGMSGAVWLKVYIDNPNFFRQFNEAYYARFDPAAQPSLSGNVPALRNIAAPLLPNGVEGQPFDEWYVQQYILDTSVSVGRKLYAFVIPSEAGAEGQSAAVTLVYFRTLPNGDEELLSGRAYATYFDAFNARINLGISAEQAEITGGEGFLTTLSFSQAGVDAGRITMDFGIGDETARTHMANGFAGDFQAAILGAMTSGAVTVTQTTVPSVQTRTQTTNLESGGFGVGLGTQNNDLAVTVVEIVEGGATTTFRKNTGDGIYHAVLRGRQGGGVQTVTKVFNSSPIPYLVSFPVRPFATSVDAALGMTAFDFLLSAWDPLRPGYETVNAANVGASVSPIEPGRGYWLMVEPATGAGQGFVNMRGIAPPEDTDFAITLPYGWNLIGSPFARPFNVREILVKYLQNDATTWDDAINQNLVAAQPFEFDPAFGYRPTDTLDGSQWKGYWVRVLVPNGVTLLLPPPASPTPRGRASLAPRRSTAAAMTTQAAPAWSVRLRAQLTPESGTSAALALIPQAEATLGAAPGATRSYDNRWDREAPPLAAVPSVSIEFPHSDWNSGKSSGGRYIGDFREVKPGAKETWDMTVTAPAPGRVTLSWAGLGSGIPRRSRLTLIDRTSGERVSLHHRSQYAFTASTAGQSRAFQIIAEPGRSLPLALTGLTVTRTRGGVNGSAGVAFSYVLSDQAEVSVEVKTLTGARTVRRLAAGRAQAAGRQTVHWNGRAEDGATLPAGAYLLSITARSEDGSVVRETRPVLTVQ